MIVLLIWLLFTGGWHLALAVDEAQAAARRLLDRRHPLPSTPLEAS